MAQTKPSGNRIYYGTGVQINIRPEFSFLLNDQKKIASSRSYWIDSPEATLCRLDLGLPTEGEVGARIRNKPTSAELRPDQNLVAAGHDKVLVEQVQQLLCRAEFKRRQAAPLLKVSPQAFGSGYRSQRANAKNASNGCSSFVKSMDREPNTLPS